MLGAGAVEEYPPRAVAAPCADAKTRVACDVILEYGLRRHARQRSRARRSECAMSGTVFAALLFAALLSAVWNAIVKSGANKFLHALLVADSAALVALILLPFLKQPAPQAWFYLGVSALLQAVYYSVLAAAFRAGDISHAYPMMRGTAPLLVSFASGPLIGEALSFGKWIGVMMVCAGVLGLAWEARYRAHAVVLRYGLLNALIIAGYTLMDGIGVRQSGAAAGYTMWNLLLSAFILSAWTLVMRPRELWRYAAGRLAIWSC